MSEIKSAPVATEDQEEISGFTASRSLGESLVPLLVIAMESCLVYVLLLGLAGFHFPATDQPLLPIWLPLSIGLGLYWFTQLLQYVRPIGTSFSTFRAWSPKILIMLLAGSSTWLSLYAQLEPIFTLQWIQSLLSDIAEMNAHFYQAIVIFVLICYLGWRGMQSALGGIELHTLARLRRLGLLCFSGVILVHLLQMYFGPVGHSSLALFLLIPIFLFLLLLAQALQQVSYLRRFHAIGLQGSAKRQERIIFFAAAILGVVTLVILLLVVSITFADSAAKLFTLLGSLYHRLVDDAFQLLLFLASQLFGSPDWQRLPTKKSLSPICLSGDQNLQTFFLLIVVFLLLLWLARTLYLRLFHASGLQGGSRQLVRQAIIRGVVLAFLLLFICLIIGVAVGGPIDLFHLHGSTQPLPSSACAFKQKKPSVNSPPNYIIIGIVLLILLTLLLGLVYLVGLIMVFLWKRYRKATQKRAQSLQGDGDTHESLWSWSLFLIQLKALLTAWLSLFNSFRKRGGSKASDEIDDLKLATPEARSIREIYRTFLKKAARTGVARTKDETPYEFRHRLNTQKPLVEPQLEAITDAYTLIRYGGGVPDEREVATIRQFWNELERKWETSSN